MLEALEGKSGCIEFRDEWGEVLAVLGVYVDDLLLTGPTNISVALPVESSLPDLKTGYEQEETLSIPILRRAQKLVGELLWLSGKTRLDVSYTVCKLGQYCSEFPSSVFRDGLKTLAYLARTSQLRLRYGSFDEP